MADFISGLLGLGNEQDPMERAKQAGLLGFGTAMLQASGPSLTPTSFGQNLGQSIMSGQQMSQQALQQARQQSIQQEMMSAMGGMGAGQGGQGGDAAAQIAKLQKMALLDPKNANTYLKLSEQLQGKTAAFTGEIGNAALNLFGTADVSKLTPEQRQQANDFAIQQKLSIARAGAPSVNVKYGESFGTKLAGSQVELIQGSQASAQGAADTLATVSDMLPIVDEAFTGPGSTVQTALTRIGQKIGVGGKSQEETLQNTAALIKGAAQLELDAAAKMRGQGSLTENERGILRRAASVDPTQLSPAEIKQVLGIIQKSSTSRISQHNILLDKFIQTQPDMQRQLELYRVGPPVPVRRVQ